MNKCMDWDMEELSKVGIDSKRTTAASVAIVGLVVYLSLIYLKSILMPLAVAVLLYFIIKPPEQFIYNKVGNRFVSYATVLLTFIITVFFTSLFLYDNLSKFIEEVPYITEKFEEKRTNLADSNLYGLEVIFSDAELLASVASPSNIETFVLGILGTLLWYNDYCFDFLVVYCARRAHNCKKVWGSISKLLFESEENR